MHLIQFIKKYKQPNSQNNKNKYFILLKVLILKRRKPMLPMNITSTMKILTEEWMNGYLDQEFNW